MSSLNNAIRFPKGKHFIPIIITIPKEEILPLMEKVNVIQLEIDRFIPNLGRQHSHLQSTIRTEQIHQYLTNIGDQPYMTQNLTHNTRQLCQEPPQNQFRNPIVSQQLVRIMFRPYHRIMCNIPKSAYKGNNLICKKPTNTNCNSKSYALKFNFRSQLA